jgi:hypothetical protein
MSHSPPSDKQLERYMMSNRLSTGNLIDKPGVKTSEFWLTLVCMVCVTLLIAVDKLQIDQVIDLWPMLSLIAGYSVSRGLAKKGQ